MKFTEILGSHPNPPHPYGTHLKAEDGSSEYDVPHRVLKCDPTEVVGLTAAMQRSLVTHHASADMLERDQRRIEAISRLGFNSARQQPGRFPTNPNTQKGNWAEIFLAEYISHSSSTQIPVYRLRYNPNVEQSMKGDDVLAFDLDSNPVRILVGEAKFRATASSQAVEEIVDALLRSHRSGIPVSLQFVADRLFDQGQTELAEKVENCSVLFALGKLRLDYVGLLVSDAKASTYTKKTAKTTLRRLAVMSMELSDPVGIVSSCYKGLTSL